MATVRQNPVPSGSTKTASSKSLAFSPSIVTSGSSRRSSLREESCGATIGGTRRAAAEASGGNSSGSPCAAMTASVSTRGSVAGPRTRTTLTSASFVLLG